MKIGVLTFHRSVNYGAFLQAFALVQSLKIKFPNAEIELVDFDMKSAKKYYYKMIVREGRRGHLLYYIGKYLSFQKAIKGLPMSDRECTSDKIDDFEKFVKGKYDIIVAGSDQIWKLTGFRGFPNAYFLPGELNCKKMSYAASSRSNVGKLDTEKLEELTNLLSDFDYIGVRDEKTLIEFGKLISNEKMYKNCDPTFLYDFEREMGKAKEVLKKYYGISDNKPCIGFMTHDTQVLTQLKKRYGDTVHYISLHIPLNGTKFNAKITPFDFVSTIAGLDFLVTSFFHGMCFAIKTGTPFCALEEKKGENRENSKMLDLLSGIEMEERYRSIDNNEYVEYVLEQVEKKALTHVVENNANIIEQLKSSADVFFSTIRSYDK